MRGQVGYWGHRGGGIAVAFGDEMMRWLDRQATERRIIVGVDHRRVVTVIADASGPTVSHCPGNHRDYPHHYTSVPSGKGEGGRARDSAFIDLALLPFGLTVIDFEETDEGLRCELPEECELAWPKLDPACDYNGRDVSEVAEEVLQSRLFALVASGQSSFRPEHRPPEAFRRLLCPGAWAKCAATAKTLSGAS